MNSIQPATAIDPSTQSLGSVQPGEIAGKRKSSFKAPSARHTGTQEDLQPPKRSKKGTAGGSGKRGAGGRHRGGGGGRGSALSRESAFAFVTPLPPNSELLAEGRRPVRLSKVDKAPQVTISEDRLSATSCKGYRMARATHGTYVGTWYYEVTITRLGATGHARLGWATARAEVQAPVGFDKHGFGYRDLEGSKVHDTWREAYGEAYTEGDVIGCWLHMPAGGRPFAHTPADARNYRSHLHLVVESPDAPQPEQLKGSAIAFTRNGVSQSVAFRDIPEGTYLPAVSLFTDQSQTEGARVACNFGPDFKHSPPQVDGFPASRPVCELSTPQEKPQEPGSTCVPLPVDRPAVTESATRIGSKVVEACVSKPAMATDGHSHMNDSTFVPDKGVDLPKLGPLAMIEDTVPTDRL